MMRPPPNPNASASNVASASRTTTNPPVPSCTTQSTQSSTMETVIELVGSTRAAQTSQAIPITSVAASTFQVDPTVLVAAQTSQAIPTSGMASSQGFLNLGTGRRMPYGMPTLLMQGLHKPVCILRKFERTNAPTVQSWGKRPIWNAPTIVHSIWVSPTIVD